MRKNVFAIGLMILSLQSNMKESEFWINYSRQDFEKASKIGEDLGKTNIDYLYLSAICDHNNYDYDSYYEKSNYYHNIKNEDYSSLKKLLDKNYKDTDYSINNLFGIIKNLIPAIDLESAQHYFEKSLNLNINNPIAQNYLSMIYMQNGDFDKGIEFAKMAIKEDNTYPEPYNNLTFGYYKKGKIDEAIDNLIECMKNCPKNTISTYENFLQLSCKEVVLLVNNTMIGVPGIEKESIRNKVLSELKGNNKALLDLANQFYQHNSYKEADVILNIIEPNSEVQGKFYYLKTMNSIISGDTINQKKYLDHLVILKEFNYLLDIGNYFYANQSFDPALKMYKIAESVANSNDSKVQVLSNIGTVDLQLGNYDNAIRTFLDVLQINDKDDITLTNIGITYVLKKEKTKAKEYLLKAKQYCHSDQQMQAIDHWLNEIEK